MHIEAIVRELGRPGGANTEVRVYVGGVLEGRRILLGRLGGTVNTFPVVAAIGGTEFLTVMPSQWISLETVVVELWEHRKERTREQ